MSSTSTQLRRELGLWGAVMMGMGSIVGTGVALCNGLSSAQLAANHPVSGGSYEYGYRYLKPWLGFTAGWMFLLAKSASAATAALGFGGYLLTALGVQSRVALVAGALAAVAVLTAVAARGMRRSNRTNMAIVGVTLAALIFFGAAGASRVDTSNFTPFFGGSAADDGNSLAGLLYATALMFVAYTGYGRIATLGEEVRDPRHTIPRAIITTMIITMLLYVAVAVVGVGAAGADALSQATQAEAAPLEVIARGFDDPGASSILAVGAITAMLGVLLNLILGLSRVLLAMGRRGDMPALTAQVELVGDVRLTWSFSAFTVLIYYALTNLAALQLDAVHRFYPRWIAWLGLVACLFLAFWVDPAVWIVGVGLIGVGLVWHTWMQRSQEVQG